MSLTIKEVMENNVLKALDAEECEYKIKIVKKSLSCLEANVMVNDALDDEKNYETIIYTDSEANIMVNDALDDEKNYETIYTDSEANIMVNALDDEKNYTELLVSDDGFIGGMFSVNKATRKGRLSVREEDGTFIVANYQVKS